MSRTPNPNLTVLYLRHAIWLRLMEASPLPPTIRELGQAWGCSSTSYVRFVIAQMVSHGLARSIQRGASHKYIPIKQEQS